MRLNGVRPDVPQPENFTYNNIKNLGHGGSATVRISASIAAALLVIASAGFGSFYAYAQGQHQGAPLALLAVCMALGLEIAKPFAVDGVFSSLRSLAIGRALAMLVLAIVAVGYSLTAELSLMAMTRGDTAASRSKAADAAKDDRAELARVTAERSAMTFTPATADAVSATHEAVTAASRTRKAECGERSELAGAKRGSQRGPNCRLRESEESTARQKLSETIAAKAATDKATALDAKADAIRARLAEAPATAAADPGAMALATYLGIFGLTVDSSMLAQWLVLVGVLALEVGSALSLLLVHAAGTPQRGRGTAILGQLRRVPDPEKAAVALPEPRETATRPAVSKKRGRPARERKEAEAKVIELLRTAGGEIPARSTRKLGRMLDVRKSTAHSALLGLLATGAIVKTAAGLVLVHG
jgi:hypothetical protein